MNQELKELAETLEMEAGYYEELTVLLEEERETLRRMDIASLEESNGVKANLISQIARLEESRGTLMSALAISQGLPEEKLRLVDLLRNAPAPLAGRLLEVRTRLREVVTEATKRNDHNQKFINEMLSIMEGIVDKLRDLFKSPSLYGENGNVDKGSLNGGDILQQSV